MAQAGGADDRALSRRSFIRVGVAGGVALSALGALLEACGGTAAAPSSTATSPAAATSAGAPASVRPSAAASVSPAASGAASAAAKPNASGAATPAGFPAYIANPNRPKPDFPSKGELYEDGYVNYPPNPTNSVKDVPGLGSTMQAFLQPLQPLPTPLNQNPAWQEVNKQLNVNFQFNFVPVADYTTKLATLMAGGDLPDMVNVFRAINGVANLPAFLQQSAQDLTPYLAGDAVKDYPNLANIPTFAWRNSGSVINGHIYMIPVERYAPGSLLVKRNDMYDPVAGKDYAPKDLDDFKRVLKLFTDPSKGKYGISSAAANTAAGASPFDLLYWSQAFGAPNRWRLESSGKLTKDFETDEFKAAVGWTRDLYASGVFHPNTLTNSSIKNIEADLEAGRVPMYVSAFGNPWNDAWHIMLGMKPPTDVMWIPPFPAPGVKNVHHLSIGFQSATFFKKAPDARIKEILRVMNWLAAPFGSQEDLLLTSGVPPADYSMDAKGNPILTDRGNKDAFYVPWKYVIQRPQVIYLPDIPNYTQTLYNVEQTLIPIGIQDPTLGYYSPTFGSKNVPVEKTFNDGLTEILKGSRPMSDYDGLLKDWQNAAGNQMRTEYMQAMSATK